MTDETRSLPAFPATNPGRAFARTWWGKAWVAALEDTSLDGRQLRKGRAFARRGQVGVITVGPGLVAATVREPSLDEFRAVVRVAELTAPQWRRMWEQVSAKPGHLLALVDGEMPAELAGDADAVDVPLLPGLGDLEPECECDAWELPCVHAAALCYQVSWLLDADPFLLLLLRGRGRDRLLGDLRARSGPVEPPGVDAEWAYAHHPDPLPRWEFEPTYEQPDDVPPGPGVDPAAMRRLVRDAAARAATGLRVGFGTPSS